MSQVSVGQKSGHSVAGFSAQGLTKLKSRCQPGLCFSSAAHSPLPDSHDWWQIHFLAVYCRIVVPVSLLAVSQRLLSALQAVHIPHYMPSSIFKPAMACWIFLVVESLTSFSATSQKNSAFKGLVCLGQVQLNLF